MLTHILRAILFIVASVAAAYLINASMWSSYRASPTLLAHRGMAQTYNRDSLERDTCTASRIHEPEHPYLENTIASMRAAFGMGADIVEFDIHPTTDGKFAVFHDWTLDCRTEAKGVTREHTMAYLKTLDIGYGYSADLGKTFPFRGTGVGLMPTLDEVLETFPDKRFLINIKSRDPNEGELLAERLLKLPKSQLAMLMAYGGGEPIQQLRKKIPDMKTMSRQTLKECMYGYVKLGWFGQVPTACHNTIVLVPSNIAFAVWGWPNRFLERMNASGTEVFVVGPLEGTLDASGTSGIDTQTQIQPVPHDFSGGIWTNRIDRVGPHFGRPHRDMPSNR